MVSKIGEKIEVGERWQELYINAVQRSIHEANVVITNTAKAADINQHQPAGMKFKP